MDTAATAVEIAAKKTGLRPDQVAAAIEEYRASLTAMTVEPEWRALMHMSGPEMAIAQYGAAGTAVCLQVESWKERGQWQEERVYTYAGKAYQEFAEAKDVEDAATAKVAIREVRNSPAALSQPPFPTLVEDDEG